MDNDANTLPKEIELDIKRSIALGEKDYLDNNHRPIKCKTCGENNILETETPISEFMVKGVDDFTGEMEFSVKYRCLKCDSLEATVLSPNNDEKVFIFW